MSATLVRNRPTILSVIIPLDDYRPMSFCRINNNIKSVHASSVIAGRKAVQLVDAMTPWAVLLWLHTRTCGHNVSGTHKNSSALRAPAVFEGLDPAVSEVVVEGVPAHALVDSGALCSLVSPSRLHAIDWRRMKSSQQVPLMRSAESDRRFLRTERQDGVNTHKRAVHQFPKTRPLRRPRGGIYSPKRGCDRRAIQINLHRACHATTHEDPLLVFAALWFPNIKLNDLCQE